MSEWNHSICIRCWNAKNPTRRPITLREEFRDEKPEICCFCGNGHGSGIYIREDPNTLLCARVHPND